MREDLADLYSTNVQLVRIWEVTRLLRAPDASLQKGVRLSPSRLQKAWEEGGGLPRAKSREGPLVLGGRFQAPC